MLQEMCLCFNLTLTYKIIWLYIYNVLNITSLFFCRKTEFPKQWENTYIANWMELGNSVHTVLLYLSWITQQYTSTKIDYVMKTVYELEKR